MVRTKYTIKPLATRKQSEIVTVGNQKSDQLAYLGKLAETGNNQVWMDAASEHVVVIVGKRGSGKSYTLGTIIESLCANEDGPISKGIDHRAIVLFDTLDIFWPSLYPVGESNTEEVRRQQKDLKQWKIDPVDLRVSVWVPAGYRSDIMPKTFNDFYLDHKDMYAEDWADLFGLDLVTEPRGQLLDEVYSVAASNDERPSLTRMLETIQMDEVIQDYAPETVRALRQRLRAYERHDIFSGETALTDFIRKGCLSVLLVNGLSDDLRAVVVSVVIRKLLRERAVCSMASKSLKLRPDLSPSDTKKLKEVVVSGIPRVTIAIDEAQNAVPRDRRTGATDLIVKLVREGRNFGTSLILTTQQPGAIDERIMAQADMMLVHKLVMQRDMEVAKKHLKSRVPDEIKVGYDILEFDDLLRTLGVGQCVLSSTDASTASNRTFVINVRPRVSRHGGFED